MDKITQSILDGFIKKYDLSNLNESEQFEYFCNYCILSQYNINLSLDDFTTDNAMGIDGMAILINNQFVESKEEAEEIIKSSHSFKMELICISSKKRNSFSADYITNIFAGINFLIDNNQLINGNAWVRVVMDIFQFILSFSSKMEKNPTLKAYLCTIGTWNEDNVLNAIKEKQILNIKNKGYFSEIIFEPVDKNKLQELFRKINNISKCTFKVQGFIAMPDMKSVKSAYLALVPIGEFIKLLEYDSSTDSSMINNNIFYDNVRDYQGDKSEANKNMKDTLLKNDQNDKFCLFNNGITILAEDGNLSGYNMTLKGYQVVNGCQTSNVIFDVYRNNKCDIKNIVIQLKIVITEDNDIQNNIIKSTNTQHSIAKEQFIALSSFSKKIEDFFKADNDHNKRLYYERRNGQYIHGDSIQADTIIDIKTLIKIFGSLVLEQPREAGRYPVKFYEKSNKDNIFQDNHCVEIYYIGAYMYYLLIKYIKTNRLNRRYKDMILYILLIMKDKIFKNKINKINIINQKVSTDHYKTFVKILEEKDAMNNAIKDSIDLLNKICDINSIDREDYSSTRFEKHFFDILRLNKEPSLYSKNVS